MTHTVFGLRITLEISNFSINGRVMFPLCISCICLKHNNLRATYLRGLTNPFVPSSRNEPEKPTEQTSPLDQKRQFESTRGFLKKMTKDRKTGRNNELRLIIALATYLRSRLSFPINHFFTN